MATRLVLAELIDLFRRQSDCDVSMQSVGGVDAAKRVQGGEPFDLVVLASDAIDKLVASGHVVADSKVDLARSGVAVAVRAGAPRPDVSTEDALRRAVSAARSISYSTGPSGVHLAKVFERWGASNAIGNKTVQAPPGVPVGTLVARGEAEIGLQQICELEPVAGIDIVGPLPAPIQRLTHFVGGIPTNAVNPDGGKALLTRLPVIRA